MNMRMHKLKQGLLSLVLGLLGLSSWAYPDRPITLIVPWAAGGSTDILARALSEQLDRKSTRLNSSHTDISRMPSSA